MAVAGRQDGGSTVAWVKADDAGRRALAEASSRTLWQVLCDAAA